MSEQTGVRADDSYGGRAGPGMRRTSMARRLGTLENHSPRYCAWRARAHSPAQFSMQDAGQARTPFTLPLWGCTFWELMWQRPHCRSRGRRPRVAA